MDSRLRDQFVLLGAVGAVLGDIMPEEAPAEAVELYADLLFLGYHFWALGKRVYSLSKQVTRILTTPHYDVGDWPLAVPPASYIQLPERRVWARVAEDSPFEPVDGAFVAFHEPGQSPDSSAFLRAQLVLGVRRDRPGISLVSFAAELSSGEARKLANDPWRDERSGSAFSNVIPGGELDDLRTITTASELGAFLIRAAHYLDSHPRALIPREQREAPATELNIIDVLSEN